MRRVIIVLAVLSISGAALTQPVRVTGVSGVKLKDLAGSPTLVTVVLRPSGAEDANLRIIETAADYFVANTETGKRVVYTYTDVAEIKVQGGKVEKAIIDLPQRQTLRAEDKVILDAALSKARLIFENSLDHQEIRIFSAMLLGLYEDSEALEYLRQLSASNDLMTQLEASYALWMVGEPIQERLVLEGLTDEDRRIRSFAAVLAGAVKYEKGTAFLNRMISDRSADLAVPAALALAQMGNREIIPQLISMLEEGNDEKAEAAIRALVMLKGDDVVEQIKIRLKGTKGQVRYRFILVLYLLKEPLGRKLLVEVYQNEPTLMPEAALLLARSDDWEAVQYLRNRMKQRVDEKEKDLMFRVRNAASLFAGGDQSVLSTIQEILKKDFPQVQMAILQLAVESGDRRFLSLIQPSLENQNVKVAIFAANAIVALTNPAYRERYLQRSQKVWLPASAYLSQDMFKE